MSNNLLVRLIVVVGVSGHTGGVLDQLNELLLLAHELHQFRIGCAALVRGVLVLQKEFFKSGASLLREQSVDFALGKSVLVSIHSIKHG